ncbi:Ketosteroid isomerase-related protein [Paraburkholderia fungorum]|uniref:Ketosteroid isomerase-related protein n=1 Tax=Paraburkholderia fungorum TaxID=134537 RepID=A0A1H1I8X0_9BURK|nr:nuclear transport factor 2 family protein [Paraburkholderia fungorum]SDR33788.1 Ketosteroid isomerase-related protein [Paraburkholderia fungorum]
MDTAKTLLNKYLESIRDPKAAAALFADDGILELPYLSSLGPTTGAQGPAAIEKFIAGLLDKVPDFKFKDVQILIDTPTQVFGEYSVEALVPSTGNVYKQMYAGRLVAANGKIKLLRESLDTVAAQKAFTAAG